jgi:hypothetical protein
MLETIAMISMFALDVFCAIGVIFYAVIILALIVEIVREKMHK